jgi:hypothetical protein
MLQEEDQGKTLGVWHVVGLIVLLGISGMLWAVIIAIAKAAWTFAGAL